MPTASNGAQNIFNANNLLIEAEIDVHIIMFILGIEPVQFASITIDEIINKIKESYDYVSAEAAMAGAEIASGANHAASKLLRTECNSLTRRARRAWFNMEFAKEVLENE